MRALLSRLCIFFFNDTATTEIYTLSLHDALPICHATEVHQRERGSEDTVDQRAPDDDVDVPQSIVYDRHAYRRSEEHTSELQSRQYLVCRLLLEKKKKKTVLNHLYYVDTCCSQRC